jgi:phage virion morphogenesis protein
MIDVQIVGLEQAILKINGIGLKQPHKVLAVAAEVMRAQTLRRFATKTAPDGRPWAPRKASRRSKRKSGSGLLVDTGRLRNSIGSKIYGLEAEVGTNVFYGKYHQYGTKKMVARPFLGIGEQDAAEIVKIIEQFIASSL